jgi:hypothetical protein
MVGDTHYLNSGDWVESLTAIVEHPDGRFEVYDYAEFCRRLEAKTQQQGSPSKLKKAKRAPQEALPVEDDSDPIAVVGSERLHPPDSTDRQK